jgi:nitroreductase
VEGFSQPVIDVIRTRISCRSYTAKPLSDGVQQQLRETLTQSAVGPFGTQMRFALAAASQDDWTSLKGLGTYGFIRGAAGFIIGAVSLSEHSMEDYGYVLERIVLTATNMGLGTCWLGGTFSKSSFARKISPRVDEVLPTVIAVGYAADRRRLLDTLIRRTAGSDHRRPWRELFFDGNFNVPLDQTGNGPFTSCLEAVRLGPSASNKQPWRILKDGPTWHFFLNRTKGYGSRNQSIGLADLQRVDMGIAICHFDSTTREAGLKGQWVFSEPKIILPSPAIEYIVSWKPL